MPKIYLALYKGRKSGIGIGALTARLQDWLVRRATGGIYSHCEIAVLDEINQYPAHIVQSDGGPAPIMYACFSASARDGGVRAKIMPLPSEKWDLIELPTTILRYLYADYMGTHGSGYDWLGILSFPLGRYSACFQRRGKWFCSEWCAHVLGYGEPHRISPNTLTKLHAPVGAPK